MVEPEQIPYLIQLLDDESSAIKERVVKELTAFGPRLQEYIDQNKLPVTPSQRQALRTIFQSLQYTWVKQVWPTWFHCPNDYDKLERAAAIISAFLDNHHDLERPAKLLDQWAQAFKEEHIQFDARTLAQYLFQHKGLEGNIYDYYDQQNSNLTYVLTQKKGIPISLTTIYMLIGHRLGLVIEGCSFPGHFLGRIDHKGRKIFIDCFSGGQVLEREDILNLRGGKTTHLIDVLEEKVPSETIIRRYLANLIKSFQMKEQDPAAEEKIALLKTLDAWVLEKKKKQHPPSFPKPLKN